MRNVGSSSQEKVWLFALFCVINLAVLVLCQPGYISIDCGLNTGEDYTDVVTGISYTSDDQFMDRGTNYNISSSIATSSTAKQLLRVRSFPDGARNCYTLKPVVQNDKYLVRATFLYGNYDKLQASMPILFYLYLDVNFWKNVNISDASTAYRVEAITIAASESISVCLINNGTGTPFMSALELRPMKNSIYEYANASQSVDLSYRINLADPAKTKLVRYPDDQYDRIWRPLTSRLWTQISTNSHVGNYRNDKFEAPSAVLQTAAVPVNSSVLEFYWDYDNTVAPFNVFYVILHFTEVLQLVPGVDIRQFEIHLNSKVWYPDVEPPYLLSGDVHSLPASPMSGYSRYNYTLTATSNSTLPPLLNALEIYSPMRLSNFPTSLNDVDAILAIKLQYRVMKNWMGDPCVPTEYVWSGLSCNYASSAPRITAINLSSSTLSGIISTSFSILTAVTYLDLSYNNLTGTIPEALGELPLLQVLNLTGNKLNGSIPASLLQRVQQNNLILILNNTTQPQTYGNKRSIGTPIIALLSVAPVALILIVVLIYIGTRRKLKGLKSVTYVQPKSENNYLEKTQNQENSHVQIGLQMQFESRQFTYAQLAKITDNFKQIIGQGGFGTVYHGYLENGKEVAVKIRSQSSRQGGREFLAEVQLLTRVHHRYLVSFIGYCNDGTYLGLVYEYLAQGTLKDHLRGRAGQARTLTWRQRLQIALEAAQGLDYLHRGCTPPIIHRDLKTCNILLSKELEAKIADFGLSKAFQNDDDTHVSTTGMAGTPGYIDPDFSFQLNEKSDVFSFGVILLELITGHPPIIAGAENVHIVQWIASKLTRGAIEDTVDVRLHGHYDANSVWKVVDVAMRCTEQSRTHRPVMSEIVVQLKESFDLVAAHDRDEGGYNNSTSPSSFQVSGELTKPVGPYAR